MGNKVKQTETQSQEGLPVFGHITETSIYQYLAEKFGGTISKAYDNHDITSEEVIVTVDETEIVIQFVHAVLSDMKYEELQTDVDRFEPKEDFYYEHSHSAYLVTDISPLLPIHQQAVLDQVEEVMKEWSQPYWQYNTRYKSYNDEHFFEIITHINLLHNDNETVLRFAAG